jgi:lipoprotein-releasing system permease protein
VVRLLFSFQIAWRYLWSKQNKNVVHLITWLSITAIAVVTASLLILLSAFNGLEGKITDVFSTLSPPLLAEPSTGKRIEINPTTLQALKAIPETDCIVRVVEESALASYGQQQRVCRIRGTDSLYFKASGMSNLPWQGEAPVNGLPPGQVAMAEGLAYLLEFESGHSLKSLQLHCPKSGGIDLLNPFREMQPYVQSFFYLQDELNSALIVGRLDDIQELTGAGDRITALYLYPKQGIDEAAWISSIEQILGRAWTLKSREQQHSSIYQILKSEKMAVLIIVGFILLVASFNLASVQTLLAVEKRKDVTLLWALGIDFKQARQLFAWVGAWITLLGSGIGLTLGFLVLGAQIKWGFFPMNALGEPFPIRILMSDLALILTLVLSIGMLVSSWRAATLHFSSASAIHYLK